MRELYFDNAATTRMDRRVLDAMEPWVTQGYGNPSSMHTQGRTARLVIENMRKKIASFLNCAPRCIIFTSGGTEAANAAIHSAVFQEKITRIIASAIEHPCVLSTADHYHRYMQTKVDLIAPRVHGSPNLLELDRMLDESRDRTLVCLMHANNETGAITDIENASAICHARNAALFCDMVSTTGHINTDVRFLGPDMASASAHKFHGPKGIGFLYVKEGYEFLPLIYGGAQELNQRAGTENVAGIVGMASALEYAINSQAEDRIKIKKLRQQLKLELLAMGAVINSPDDDHCLYTIISAGFERNSLTENLLLRLDMEGVCVSGGSACSSTKRSHVMKAIEADDRVNIRFSFSRFNEQDEIRELTGVLKDLLKTEKTGKHEA